MSRLDPETARQMLRRAQVLAGRGLGQCRSCKKTLPLTSALTTWLSKTLVYAICWECMASGRRVVLRRCPSGVEVVLENGDGPLIAVPNEVTGPGPAVPELKRKELGG